MTGDPGIDGAEVWADAVLSMQLFAVDPSGLNGVSLRAMPGPVRDRWTQLLRRGLGPSAPLRRLPLHTSDDRLLGGLDLTATLQAGRPIAQKGVLSEADGGVLMAAMAERLPPAVAVHLSAALDAGEIAVERDGFSQRLPARIGIVALDEGLADDERPPTALCDRLAFHLDLGAIALGETEIEGYSPEEIAQAGGRLHTVTADDDVLRVLCGTAAVFGIASLRAPYLALRAACASAALEGRETVSEEDIVVAARLVLAPRATMLPQPEAPEDDQPPPEEPQESTDDDRDESLSEDQQLEDMVLQAALAAIPPGLLSQLRSGVRQRGPDKDSGRAGAIQASTQRGRPAGTRPGELKSGARLNVVETLRAAAPWQPVRRRGQGDAGEKRVLVDRDDFRINRFKRRTQTTTIFVVDASGSAALHRLAEAKGAVELLLAESYVRRDRVAVIAFRGQTAEILLPPTRSLVRAKRSLAALPGGGGTPLASGIDAAHMLAESVARQGDTPVIVLLTDGKANVTRDGQPGREQAGQDVTTAAKGLRSQGWSSLLIDVSQRPSQKAKQVADDMGAQYHPLPHADARALSEAVRAATDGPRLAGAA